MDILPPAPVIGSDGKCYDVNRSDEGAADVTFNLEDASGLADSFSYALDYDNRTSFPYGNSNAGLPTSNSKDSVTIQTSKDTRESVTVWTQFSDRIGNTMDDYIKTDPINFDTRHIDAEYYCNTYGVLQKTYDFKVKINKNPFSGTGNSTQEGTLKIKYKWLPLGIDINSDKAKKIDFSELSFTSTSKEVKDGMEVSLTPEGFQQEWLRKLRISGSAFQGYYRCYARVELWSKLDGNTEQLVNEVDLSYRERYFDNTPPTVAFRPFSKAYANRPVIAFDISDDGSSASVGNSINMNKEYTYYTYAVKRTEASGKDYYVDILSDKNPIYTTTYSIIEPNLGGKKTADGKIIGVDDTEVYVKVTVEDEAGNKADGIIGGPIRIDINAPVVNEPTVNIKEGAESLAYQNETGTYTVVKDLTDITGVTLNITDNTSANVTIAGDGGSKATLKCVEGQSGVYSGTLNLTASDFAFIESTMGGAAHYCAKLAITDEAGNTAYSYFNAIVDNSAVYSNTPYVSLSSNGDEYTTENVIARQYININDFETVDMLRKGISLTDPNGNVEGEPVIVIGAKTETETETENDNSKNYIELTLKENTTSSADQPSDVYITITDAFGNTSGEIYFKARGIDKTPPTLTVTPSSDNVQHEGVFTISASDNEYLIGVDAALMKDGAVPEESDYFSSVWPSSTLLREMKGKSGEIDEPGETDVSEKSIGYAPSYANLDVSPTSTSSLTGSFNYSCLPTGNYTLYIRTKDGAGNAVTSTHSFTADNKAPEVLDVSYSPTQDRKTGGTVSVTVKTDQPVTIQKTPSEVENTFTYYLQDMVRDFMEKGFTYRFNGELRNLSLYELELRRFHYWSVNAWELKSKAWEEADIEVTQTLTEKGYSSDTDEYYEAYDKMFQAMVSLKYMDKLREADRDEATGISLADEDYYLFGDFAADDESPPVETEELKKMKELLEELDVHILSFFNGDEYEDRGYHLPYDKELELGTDEKIKQAIREEIIERVAGYYLDKDCTIVDESIFKLQVANPRESDDYEGSEDPEESNVFDKHPELINYATVNFLQYPEAIDSYLPEITSSGSESGAPTEESTPLSANGSDDFSDLKEKLKDLDQADISEIQTLRQNAITLLATKFADMGKAAVDQSFKTENVVTYRNNAEETLYAVNKFGQATPVDIRIDNIDQANVPNLSPGSVALVYRNGTEAYDVDVLTDLTVKIENINKVRFVADAACNILSTGENANLYFFDFRLDGEPLTVSESVYANITVIDSVYNNPFFGLNELTIRTDFPDLDNMTFYKTFEADLKGKNGLITFKYLDPSFAGQDGKTYWAESSYLVNVFDLEPPTGTIQYSMDPDGYSIDPDSPTNKNIVASVVSVQDNRTDSNMIYVYYDGDTNTKKNTTFTFTDNGSKTFVLEDYAGNKTYLTATVTGIDKTAPILEGKFFIGEKEVVAEMTGDVCKYAGPYTNGIITAKVIDSDTGEVYSTYVFDHNETVSIPVSDAAGNLSTITFTVDRFDFTAPVPDPSSIRYYVEGTEFTGTSTNKNVKVRFTVTDNIIPDPSSTTPWIDVSGLNMRISKVMTEDGIVSIQETKLTDTSLVKSLGGNLYELEFEYNGTADIYFTDGVGNQAMITITVDMIDKIPPSVKSEVRTSAKGVPVNEPVTVAVYPDEMCNGWITDNKGNNLKPNVPREGLSAAPLTYTFDKENDGDSNMVWFHFEDASGNKLDYQVTAYDIDLTPPVLQFELVAVNKGIPLDKLLPIDKTEAEKQLIPYNGAATYRISVTPTSKVTSTGTELDQFTGGIMTGDTIELVNRPNMMYHTFMANGDYIFYYRDLAGNMKSYTLTVNCIDNNKPNADVSFTPVKADGNTRDDVVITISPYDIDAGGSTTDKAYVYWNREKYSTSGNNTFTYTATENGEYEFVVVDDSGNSNTVKTVVDWIDKEAPVIQAEGYADIYVMTDDGNNNDEPVIETIRKNIRKLTITDNMDGSIAFDDTRVTVEYYLSDGVTPVDIDAVDFSKAGEYLAIIKVRDNVGNEAQLPRRIIVIGTDDVLPFINNQIIMPSEIAYFYTGDLSLKVLNLEKAGGTVYYSFVRGEYHPAELKGFNKEAITTEMDDIKLQTSGSGIYTLVITTQERKTVVVYVFVASNQ